MNTTTTPFSLRIFVADGDPDGLRIVDKSNWIGKALVFPRALLPQVKARPELAQTGVYLLLGPLCLSHANPEMLKKSIQINHLLSHGCKTLDS